MRGGSGASLLSSGHVVAPCPGHGRRAGLGACGRWGGGSGTPRPKAPAGPPGTASPEWGRPPTPCRVACVCGVRGPSSLCVCVRRSPVPLLWSGAVGGHAVTDRGASHPCGAAGSLRRKEANALECHWPHLALVLPRQGLWNHRLVSLDSNLLLLPLSLLFPHLAPRLCPPLPSSLTGANSGQTDHRSSHNVHRGLRHHHGAGGTR